MVDQPSADRSEQNAAQSAEPPAAHYNQLRFFGRLNERGSGCCEVHFAIEFRNGPVSRAVLGEFHWGRDDLLAFCYLPFRGLRGKGIARPRKAKEPHGGVSTTWMKLSGTLRITASSAAQRTAICDDGDPSTPTTIP